ncbi:MAG: hypothetical protein JL50_21225 [Peptococcaceae bacterium BICA1-7]|nr:MAG: hypothetical protein JL50_21225 [Peptococcaceae bacterium BICA1-7]HBV97149.1 hypothetical protein [Desulfotomaculum sp.]
MAEKRYEDIVPGQKPLKTMLARAVFWFLGRGFQAAAALDSKVREETAGWPEQFTMVMKIEPRGPVMVMGKRKGEFVYLGSKEVEAHLAVSFKSIDAALKVLLGLSGIDQSFAEHRFSMKGDIIAYGMPLTRCLYRVEAYLFPPFIARRILKKMPEKERGMLRIYLKTLFNL